MKKETELIECLKSFIKSKHLTNEWDKFRDTWFTEIHSEASSESQSVRDNEVKEKKCNHGNYSDRIYDCATKTKYGCQTCPFYE